MQRLSLKEAKQKICSFCAYQERSHFEVKQKLFSYGLYANEVDQVLADLIEENFLNEERFAKMFAGGKFRMKGWGRVKISQELKFKKVSPYNIRIALREIDPVDYQEVLDKLAEKKWKSLKGRKVEKAAKTTRFLMQRGFELPLIQDSIASLTQED